MSSDQVTTEAPDAAAASPAPASGRRPGAKTRWGTIALAIIALNVLAFILFPPFPKGGQAGDACDYPTCFIQGNFEFPVPHVVIDFDPANAPAADQLVTFHPSISSTLVTMWIVIGVILVAVIAATRGRAMVPGRVQNFSEFVYESLQNFGLSLGGEAGRPYIPIFAAFFLFILLSNWSGLIPPIGKIEELRAPTSDVNVTLGLALVSFFMFEGEGFRKLGFAGYAGIEASWRISAWRTPIENCIQSSRRQNRRETSKSMVYRFSPFHENLPTSGQPQSAPLHWPKLFRLGS